jgi:8-hydroxy-5-deazaflavin:NADPH oxidoreductase
MRIAVLGTGSVGWALAGRLAEWATRSRSARVTCRRPWGATRRTRSATPPFATWLEVTGDVTVAALTEAAAGAEVVINATSGAASLDALTAAGEDNLAGKVLVDVANPPDASTGMPPALSVSNTDSLAERIQRRFPAARVVKTLNAMNAA